MLPNIPDVRYLESNVSANVSFTTREPVRMVQVKVGCQVLVGIPHEARVIEAYTDMLVAVIRCPFPQHNIHRYTTNKAELSQTNREANLAGDMHNKVRKD